MCADRCAVALVHADATAIVGFQSCCGEVQVLGRTLPARGVEHGVGRDPLAALQVRDGAVVMALHTDHGVAEAEDDSQVAEVVLQRLGDLSVAELEQPLALFDHRDLGAQRREHRGVLDADHAGADHDQRRGDRLEVEDAVGVEHVSLVEAHRCRPGRAGAHRDDDAVGGHVPHVVAVGHRDRVLVLEPPHAGDQLDVVSGELVADDVDLTADHRLGAPQQVVDGQVVLDPVGLAVERALAHTGQVDDGLAQSL